MTLKDELQQMLDAASRPPLGFRSLRSAELADAAREALAVGEERLVMYADDQLRKAVKEGPGAAFRAQAWLCVLEIAQKPREPAAPVLTEEVE